MVRAIQALARVYRVRGKPTGKPLFPMDIPIHLLYDLMSCLDSGEMARSAAPQCH
jgi:hypothetical protein